MPETNPYQSPETEQSEPIDALRSDHQPLPWWIILVLAPLGIAVPLVASWLHGTMNRLTSGALAIFGAGGIALALAIYLHSWIRNAFWSRFVLWASVASLVAGVLGFLAFLMVFR